MPAAERRIPWTERSLPTARRGPSRPERFGVLQSLLAYLLAACGEERDAVITGARADRAVLDPRRGARGAPLAAQPGQLRRRLLRGLRRAARRRGARRQGALRRHVPPRAAADPARGAGDPARARVRRPDDRRRVELAARPGARRSSRHAFGAVRPHADADAAGGRRGGPRRDADPRDRPPAARSSSST